MGRKHEVKKQKTRKTGWQPPRPPEPASLRPLVSYALLALAVAAGAILAARLMEYRSAKEEYAGYQ